MTTGLESIWIGFAFDEASSRFFYLNWLGAGLLVVLGLALPVLGSRSTLRPRGRATNEQRARIREGAQRFLKWTYWWNRSTQVDYILIGLNAMLRALLSAPWALLAWWCTSGLIDVLSGVFGRSSLNWQLSPVAAVAASLFAFVFDDFLRYAHHRLMHGVPFLNAVHRTHHSAAVLTPFTLLRVHPIEVILSGLRNVWSVSTVTALFVFCFGQSLNLWTFFGVNGFAWIFNFLGSQLRHSSVPLSFGPLEKIFISPLQHQLHHLNNRHLSASNFGVSLSLWDWMSGTLVTAKQARSMQLDQANLSFGAGSTEPGSLISALVPFALAQKSSTHSTQSFNQKGDEMRDADSNQQNGLKSLRRRFILKSGNRGRVLGTSLTHVALVLCFGFSWIASAQSSHQVPLRVVTDRPVERLDAFATEYARLTGLTVDIVSVPNAEQAVGTPQNPGPLFAADLILVKDLAIAQRLIDARAVSAFDRNTIAAAQASGVYPALVDASSGYFVGLTARVRTLAYSAALPPSLVNSINTYEDLASPNWAGRLCLRTSANDYNRVLIAGLMARMGTGEALIRLLSGWVSNLAKPVNSNDRSVLQDIANGVCDIGLVNHYYWANEKDQNPQFPVEIKILDQARGGALMNGSFVLRGSVSNADPKFIHLGVGALLAASSQVRMAGAHNEIPAVQSVAPATPYARTLWPLQNNPESMSVVRSAISSSGDVANRAGYR